MPDPKSLGYRMPAEWEPHEGTWLSWPHSPRSWAQNFGPIPSVFVKIVGGLCEFEKVHICVANELSKQGVERMLREAKVDLAAVSFHIVATNDAWARDHGPIFIVKDQPATRSNPALFPVETEESLRTVEAAASARLAIIDWKFNSWGEKYHPWDDDDAVPERVAEILRLPCFHPRMVLEGGSIDVNGKGSLLTTEAVLLNPNRNPSMSRKQIESRLDEYLAARNVIWLGGGIAGDDTDGHVDDLARFVNERTVLAVVEEDPEDVNYKALRENFERLQGAQDQEGNKFELIKLPTPGKVLRGGQNPAAAGERLPASYANFFIGNGSVLAPVFGHENDRQALGLLGDLFPGRKIIGIDCKDLVGGYGAIHCVTQQQPKG
jgi:agmatine deiminase